LQKSCLTSMLVTRKCWNPMNQDTASLKKSINDIFSKLQAAATQLDTGETVDLSGLDRSVASICESIKSLPPAIQTGFKNDMVMMIDEVTQLTTKLQARQEEIRKTLGGQSAHGKAASAYGRKPGENS
jgi:hypothetical protein